MFFKIPLKMFGMSSISNYNIFKPLMGIAPSIIFRTRQLCVASKCLSLQKKSLVFIPNDGFIETRGMHVNTGAAPGIFFVGVQYT